MSKTVTEPFLKGSFDRCFFNTKQTVKFTKNIYKNGMRNSKIVEKREKKLKTKSKKKIKINKNKDKTKSKAKQNKTKQTNKKSMTLPIPQITIKRYMTFYSVIGGACCTARSTRNT